uniref:Uncharacterized protein n=1 Tax=Schizophyllum commune (strain H4-8 / FGSC 9210) TaxID=578458 RepID=D8Q1N4_SCHCM
MASTVKTEPNAASIDLGDWMKDRPKVFDASLPMNLKHKENIGIESANTASRETTWRYKADPNHYPHLGAPIKPLYAYTDEERTILLHDRSLDWNTLPSFLREELALLLAEEKASQAERDTLIWRAQPFTQCGLGNSWLLPVPPVYRAMLLAGCHIPLTWFLDHIMRRATDLSRVTTKDITLLSESNKPVTVSIIDVEHMDKKFWPDDQENGLNFYTWEPAFKNLLRVCQTLAPLSDAIGEKTNITAQLKQHFDFFCDIPDVDRRFADCYPTERALRATIFEQRAFNRVVWQDLTDSAMSAAAAARAPPPQQHHNNNSGIPETTIRGSAAGSRTYKSPRRDSMSTHNAHSRRLAFAIAEEQRRIVAAVIPDLDQCG